MSLFGMETRAELRNLLISNEVPFVRASMIVNLACHAADGAIELMSEIVDTAPDGGAKMMALEIALQLAPSQMSGMLAEVHKLASGLDIPQAAAPVTVKP